MGKRDLLRMIMPLFWLADIFYWRITPALGKHCWLDLYYGKDRSSPTSCWQVISTFDDQSK